MEDSQTNYSESFIGDLPDELMSSEYKVVERICKSRTGYFELYKLVRAGKWTVAKCLKPEYRGNPALEQLLHKEFQIGYRLSDENLCANLDFIRLPELGVAVLMEFIDGHTLRWHIEQGEIDQKIAEKWILQLCHALSYMHRHQTIHRDIKPENILVTSKGYNIKVIDFGYSDTDDASLFKQPAGTRKYAAPELKDGLDYDQRVDIYSLGITMEELLKSCNCYSRKWKKIVRQCTASNPDERFVDADALLSAINDRRLPIKIVSLIAIILPLLAVGGWLLTRNSKQADKTEQSNVLTDSTNTLYIATDSNTTIMIENTAKDSLSNIEDGSHLAILPEQESTNNEIEDKPTDVKDMRHNAINVPDNENTKYHKTPSAVNDSKGGEDVIKEQPIVNQTDSDLLEPDFSDVNQLHRYYARKKANKEHIPADGALLAEGDPYYMEIYQYSYDLCSNAIKSGNFDKDKLYNLIVMKVDETVKGSQQEKMIYEIYAVGILNRFIVDNQEDNHDKQ